MTGYALHLMRHGAPQMAGRLLGHLDAPPEQEGVALCRERAARLDFDAVATSDLSRASTPGLIIAGERGVDHRSDRRWRELDFGAWEGADPAELPADQLGRFWNDPDASPPPGGERWSQLRDRVALALADLRRPTLVICHAGAIRAALTLLCGFSQRQGWAFDLPYGACLSLRMFGEGDPAAQITALTT